MVDDGVGELVDVGLDCAVGAYLAGSVSRRGVVQKERDGNSSSVRVTVEALRGGAVRRSVATVSNVGAMVMSSRCRSIDI
jgi:hypothetical protein